MNVIRMIKLFGWEPRIAAQLSEKREKELVSIRKSRMLGLSNQLFKCVSKLCLLSRSYMLTGSLPAT